LRQPPNRLRLGLFVIDPAQGRGHGTSLLDVPIDRLHQAGHRQAFLTTGPESKAAAFYCFRGWRRTGIDLRGDVVFRLWL
jgi:hypothetical protein